MSTVTCTMELRGEMVAVTCEVYRSFGQLCVEEEVVVDHPDWELSKEELKAIQETAIAFYRE